MARIGQITETKMLVDSEHQTGLSMPVLKSIPGPSAVPPRKLTTKITICSIRIDKNAGYPVLRRGHPSFQSAPLLLRMARRPVQLVRGGIRYIGSLSSRFCPREY